MRLRTILMGSLLWIVSMVPARAANPLSIVELLERAARTSEPAVRAQAELEGSEAEVDAARSAWWPRLQARGRYIVRDNEVEVTDPQGVFRFPTTQQRNGEYEISLEEVLFDAGRRARRIRAAERLREAVREEGRASILEQQVRALQAYLDGVTLAGRREVLTSRLQALHDLHRTVSDLFEQGLVARNDLLQTEVRERQVEDAVAAVEHARRVALLEVERAMGEEPRGERVLPDSLPRLPEVSGDLPAWIARSRAANPALRAADERERAAELAAAIARREYWPVVVATASHAWQENDYLVHEHLNQATLGLRWELFDGGRRNAEARAAAARQRAASRARLEVQRTLRVQVERLAREIEQARREERTAETNVQAARENYRILADQYREGLVQSSDVLEAEALLADSRFEVLERRARTYLARALLAAAMGEDLGQTFGDFTTSATGAGVASPEPGDAR